MLCITESILKPRGSKRACAAQWGTAPLYLAASRCGQTPLSVTDSPKSKVSTCLAPNTLLAIHSLFSLKHKTLLFGPAQTQFILTAVSHNFYHELHFPLARSAQG